MTDAEIDALVKLAGYHHEHALTGRLVLINPDGPKFSAAITTLRAQLAAETARANRAEAERAAQIEVDKGLCDAKADLGEAERYILEFLSYNPETGVLTWRPRSRGNFNSDNEFGRWNTRYANKPAGGFDGHKYVQVRVNGKKELAHRVAWFLSYGEWPAEHIDHVNGNRSDNRLSNLRVVSCAENAKNRSLTTQNSSGVVGVAWNNAKSVWQSQITVGGKQIHLGSFADFQSAVVARRNAEEEYGFHPNHGRYDRTALDRHDAAARAKALREGIIEGMRIAIFTPIEQVPAAIDAAMIAILALIGEGV